jgi:UDP-N-acetyl-D-mannosaminuronic acid transferase (WecB/TagA/CpsF family)
LVNADGMPVVRASHLLSQPLKERVTRWLASVRKIPQ